MILKYLAQKSEGTTGFHVILSLAFRLRESRRWHCNSEGEMTHLGISWKGRALALLRNDPSQHFFAPRAISSSSSEVESHGFDGVSHSLFRLLRLWLMVVPAP